jgi:hypothetical protein
MMMEAELSSEIFFKTEMRQGKISNNSTFGDFSAFCRHLIAESLFVVVVDHCVYDNYGALL